MYYPSKIVRECGSVRMMGHHGLNILRSKFQYQFLSSNHASDSFGIFNFAIFNLTSLSSHHKETANKPVGVEDDACSSSIDQAILRTAMSFIDVVQYHIDRAKSCSVYLSVNASQFAIRCLPIRGLVTSELALVYQPSMAITGSDVLVSLPWCYSRAEIGEREVAT